MCIVYKLRNDSNCLFVCCCFFEKYFDVVSFVSRVVKNAIKVLKIVTK